MTTITSERDLVVARAVGARIHQLMWQQRVTQLQVGELLGIGAPTVSRKLRGAVPITVDELTAIARLLGVEPGDLLPRLDSNQQPSGYLHPLVSGGSIRFCHRCQDYYRGETCPHCGDINLATPGRGGWVLAA